MNTKRIEFTQHMRATSKERHENLGKIIHFCDSRYKKDEWNCCDECMIQPICEDKTLKNWDDLSDSAISFIVHELEKENGC